MTGIERIAAERQRQIEVEGWTADHDAEHEPDALALAAVCYALPEKWRSLKYEAGGGVIDVRVNVSVALWHTLWPWADRWWKPNDDRIRELEKAGALIAAEIDRLEATR